MGPQVIVVLLKLAALAVMARSLSRLSDQMGDIDVFEANLDRPLKRSLPLMGVILLLPFVLAIMIPMQGFIGDLLSGTGGLEARYSKAGMLRSLNIGASAMVLFVAAILSGHEHLFRCHWASRIPDVDEEHNGLGAKVCFYRTCRTTGEKIFGFHEAGKDTKSEVWMAFRRGSKEIVVLAILASLLYLILPVTGGLEDIFLLTASVTASFALLSGTRRLMPENNWTPLQV